MASNNKIKAVMIRSDAETQISMLTDKEAGWLLKALLHYANSGEVMLTSSRLTKVVFEGLRSVHDSYSEHYAMKCAKTKAAAEERWRRKREEEAKLTDASAYERMQTDASAYGCIQIKVNESKVNESKVNTLTSDETGARARGQELDKYVDSCTKDQTYIENVCMALHIQPERVKTLLSAFLVECKAKSTIHYNEKDFRCHFFDWARIQTEKGRRGKSNFEEDVNDEWK